MRFRNISLAAIVSTFVVCSAAGQDLGNKVSFSYSLNPRPIVTITNNYRSPLTGMVMTVSSTVAPYHTMEIIWFDSGVNVRHDPPLVTGQSLSFSVGPVKQAPNLQPHLMAVTFEDSTFAGDPQWLAKLHERRQAAYDEIGTVTRLLSQALAQHQPNDQIISTLNDMDASLRTSVPEMESRAAADLVIGTAVSNLQRGGIGGYIGDPQKTIPLVLLPLLERWREALKRYDGSIT